MARAADGVLPAVMYAVGEGGRQVPQDKIRAGFLAAAAVGYLGKHNATLSGAEGGCQAEIGVASAMGAAVSVVLCERAAARPEAKKRRV
jgi:L-serine dehydratase